MRFRRNRGRILQLGDPLQRRFLYLPRIPRGRPLVIELGKSQLARCPVLFRLGEVSEGRFPLSLILLLILAANIGDGEERRIAAGAPASPIQASRQCRPFQRRRVGLPPLSSRFRQKCIIQLAEIMNPRPYAHPPRASLTPNPPIRQQSKPPRAARIPPPQQPPEIRPAAIGNGDGGVDREEAKRGKLNRGGRLGGGGIRESKREDETKAR